jgi:hypothetical protein
MAGLIPVKFPAVSTYSACAAIPGPTGTGFSQVSPLNQVDALAQFFFGHFRKATVDYNDYK